MNLRTVSAALILLAAAATIAGAWGFELIGHYVPCKLCLEERIPYYVGLPVAALALGAAWRGRADLLARLLLFGLAALFAYSAYKGLFHAGVEWKWWEGPSDCGVTAGPSARDTTSLLEAIQTIRIVTCTDAAWRFPNAEWGLSFAGWNAAISTGIAIVALIGARGGRR